MKPTRRLSLIAAVIIVALLLWVGLDLFGPQRADIRRFDPNKVAHLDTVMWRSYYGGNPRELFFQLAELMRRQFHFPLLRSNEVAAHAAKAAFVFKDGHNRTDYEKALPELVKYFQAIQEISKTPFSTCNAPRAWSSNGGLFTANEGTMPTGISRGRWPKPLRNSTRFCPTSLWNTDATERTP